jgi:hypothetical protein
VTKVTAKVFRSLKPRLVAVGGAETDQVGA